MDMGGKKYETKGTLDKSLVIIILIIASVVTYAINRIHDYNVYHTGGSDGHDMRYYPDYSKEVSR